MVALSLANTNKYQRVIKYKNILFSDDVQDTTGSGQATVLPNDAQDATGNGQAAVGATPTESANPNNPTNPKYPQYINETIAVKVDRHPKRFTDDEIHEAISDYQRGKTVYELADKFGCHRNTISKVLKKHGVNVTIRKVFDTTQIASMYNSGLTSIQIADELGLCKTTVLKYIRESGIIMRGRWD